MSYRKIKGPRPLEPYKIENTPEMDFVVSGKGVESPSKYILCQRQEFLKSRALTDKVIKMLSVRPK